jgi:hypothetical protein
MLDGDIIWRRIYSTDFTKKRIYSTRALERVLSSAEKGGKCKKKSTHGKRKSCVPKRKFSVSHCFDIRWVIQLCNVGGLLTGKDIFVFRTRIWPKPNNVILHSSWICSYTSFLECVNLDK